VGVVNRLAVLDPWVCHVDPPKEVAPVIRVLVVDDHALVRAGLRGLLDGSGDIEVVGECADGSLVRTTAERLRPEVVLMDVQMPIMSGLEATRSLREAKSGARVIVLTGSVSPGTMDAAVAAGAVGYLIKGGDPNLVVSAVRTVAAGGTAWPD
jgi:DNA-binding NarL/FixJ family response regulator